MILSLQSDEFVLGRGTVAFQAETKIAVNQDHIRFMVVQAATCNVLWPTFAKLKITLHEEDNTKPRPLVEGDWLDAMLISCLVGCRIPKGRLIIEGEYSGLTPPGFFLECPFRFNVGLSLGELKPPTWEEARRVLTRTDCHILFEGLPLCRFQPGLPNSWPKEHGWVRLDESHLANCQECIKRVTPLIASYKLNNAIQAARDAVQAAREADALTKQEKATYNEYNLVSPNENTDPVAFLQATLACHKLLKRWNETSEHRSRLIAIAREKVDLAHALFAHENGLPRAILE